MVRFCPHCWREIPFDADRCPHCGRTTTEPEASFVDKLLGTLRHPEPTRVGLAIDILVDRLHETRAVESLIDLLATTKDISILQQAARGLGWLGDRRAVGPLARLLGEADAPFVARREAAFALGKLGGAEAERGLSLALADPVRSVAAAARQALGIRDEQPEAEEGMTDNFRREFFPNTERHALTFDITSDDWDALQQVLAENEWERDEGLRQLLAAGIAYAQGQAQLAALDHPDADLAAEVRRLQGERMRVESRYAVMKFRAFNFITA